MSRKSRRTQVPQAPPPEAVPPPPRYRPLARPTVTQADFTDQTQYIHVRQDLLRIGILAASLFGALILLWLLWPFLEPLGPRIREFLLPLLRAVRV